MDPLNVENVSSDESQDRKGKRKSQPLKTESVKKKSKPATSKTTGGSTKKGKSTVWADFEKFKDEDGNQRARCKHCSKDLAADPVKNGTSALSKHAKRCEKHPDYLKNQSNIFVKMSEDGEGGSCEVKAWKFCAKASRRAIAEMVILDELPFKACDYEYPCLDKIISPHHCYTKGREIIEFNLEKFVGFT